MPRLEQGVSAREDDITGSLPVYARCLEPLWILPFARFLSGRRS